MFEAAFPEMIKVTLEWAKNACGYEPPAPRRLKFVVVERSSIAAMTLTAYARNEWNFHDLAKNRHCVWS
jgi:hypothetical protein